MSIYGVRKEELIGAFEKFLREQEGDVSAQIIAECWNDLAEEYKWSDRLKAIKEADNDR